MASLALKLAAAGLCAASVAGQAPQGQLPNSTTIATETLAAAAGQALAASATQAPVDLSAAYSREEALEFAYLAQSAFCPGIEHSWECGPCNEVPGVEDVRRSDDADLSAHNYVGRWRGQCVVAFRGTDATRAWIQDLKSLVLSDWAGCSSRGKPCQVGAGFKEDYRSLSSKIKSRLSDINCTKESPLVVTGHSLGGALATLALYDLADSGYNVTKGYTFGSPRVGDDVFAEAFAEALGSVPVFRVTNADDPVPLVPAHSPFSHVGQEVYYPSRWGSSPRFCTGNEDDSCCAGQEWRLFWLTIKCAFGSCGHTAYFPRRKPFREECGSRVEAVLLP